MYEDFSTEKKVKYVENTIPKEYLNKIFRKSSEKMEELPDNSLMVTSPPYNVGKEYDQNLSFTEYREFLKSVWTFPAVSARKIGHPAPFPEHTGVSNYIPLKKR